MRRWKIYGPSDNIFDAVEVVVNYGVVAIEGTKTQAVNYAERIIKALKVYSEIEATIGYQNVQNNGYLYYVVDLNRFPIGSKRLKEIIDEIDRKNPCIF